MIGKISVSATIRNLLRFAVLLLTAGALSCVRGEEIGAPEETAEATLRVSTRSAVMRADAYFEDDPFAEGNEEAIRRISLFFFDDAASTEPAFFTYDADASDETTADLTVKIPAHLLAGKTAAYVYALVNLPETVKVDKSTGEVAVPAADGEKKYGASLDGLKSVWVNDDRFAAQGSVPGSFVMRGGAAVSVAGTGSGSTVAGTVFVERLASKIRLWADIEKTVYVDTETGKTIDPQDDGFQEKMAAGTVEEWRSVTDGQDKVRLYLHNLATRGRIGGYSDGTYFGSGYTDDDYSGREEALDYANVDRSKDEVARTLVTGLSLNETDINGGGAKEYPFTHAVAYYSYPNIWNSTSQAEKFQTYMLVSVLWERDTDDGDKEYQTCWYQVPVNALRGMTQTSGEADRLDPNRYYRIKVHIGMLGSMNPGEAPELDASYEIVDWETQEVNVDIKDRRYLVVNQTDWVMNNASSIEIPFSTSHRTIVSACYVNYFRYNDIWGTDNDANEKAANRNDIQLAHPELYHNKKEFESWLAAADSQLRLKGGKDGEGVISADFDGVTGDTLYYKSEYFNDPIIGYTYYVGHEHPKTVKRRMIKYETAAKYMTDKREIGAWNLYNTQYNDINAVYTCEIDPVKSVIRFTHPLVLWEEKGTGKETYYVPDTFNDEDGNPVRLRDEFSRVEIIIKIRHEDRSEDEGLFEETIYITQYPGMYIEVSHNYSAAARNGGAESTSTEVSQYILANGQRVPYHNAGGQGEPPYYMSYTPLPNFLGSNNNPNMYLIHTTQLSEGNEQLYEIGDPRSLFYNDYLSPEYTIRTNWLGQTTITYTSSKSLEPLEALDETESFNVTTWSGMAYVYVGYDDRTYTNVALAQAENIVSSERNVRLRYYYPTDETEGSGSKENFIAPVFRIASSFGKVAVGYRIEARRRCAVYQEAGRPAGRWRLPTKAEIKYIARLSADGKIPILLGDNNDPSAYGEYWSAQGGLLVNGMGDVKDATAGASGATGVFAPRCVYDEWYWNKIDGKPLPTPNGDKERTFYWGDVKKDNTQVDPKVSTRKYVNPNNTVAR